MLTTTNVWGSNGGHPPTATAHEMPYSRMCSDTSSDQVQLKHGLHGDVHIEVAEAPAELPVYLCLVGTVVQHLELCDLLQGRADTMGD